MNRSIARLQSWMLWVAGILAILGSVVLLIIPVLTVGLWRLLRSPATS